MAWLVKHKSNKLRTREIEKKKNNRRSRATDPLCKWGALRSPVKHPDGNKKKQNPVKLGKRGSHPSDERKMVKKKRIFDYHLPHDSIRLASKKIELADKMKLP